MKPAKNPSQVSDLDAARDFLRLARRKLRTADEPVLESRIGGLIQAVELVFAGNAAGRN